MERTIKSRLTRCAALASLLALPALASSADDTYRLYELTDFTHTSPSPNLTYPRKISETSVVIGFVSYSNSDPAYRPAMWYRRKASDLSRNYSITEVASLNDRGEFAGVLISGDVRTPVAGRQHETVTLPGFPRGGYVRALNNRGEMGVVTRGIQNGYYYFRGQVTPLPQEGLTEIVDMNNGGVILGFRHPYSGNEPAQMFIWDHGTQTLIGRLPAEPTDGLNPVVPVAINDVGQVVGMSATKPFLWKKGVTTALSLATPGRPYTGVQDINDAGVIVGYSGDATAQQVGVVWRDGAARDLNTLVAAGEKLKSYVTIKRAVGINTSGEIIAVGADSRMVNVQHSYLLRPTRLPADDPD